MAVRTTREKQKGGGGGGRQRNDLFLRRLSRESRAWELLYSVPRERLIAREMTEVSFESVFLWCQ